jgi:hypothetical protein
MTHATKKTANIRIPPNCRVRILYFLVSLLRVWNYQPASDYLNLNPQFLFVHLAPHFGLYHPETGPYFTP